MEDLFIKASRMKPAIRFATSKGELAIEDLWSLSLPSLDTLASNVDKQLQETSGKSFIKAKTTANTVLQLKLDILVYIINTKMAEEEASKEEGQVKQQESFIDSIIAEKQVDELKSLSVEELMARKAALKKN